MSSEYGRVSESIADLMFGSESAGRPVYTLPDCETLRCVLATAEVEGRDAEALATIVRTTLQLDERGVAPFRWHVDMARRHRTEPLETPPALPLLVVLTIAAEQMQSDGDLAAHNYYSRLHRMLRVPMGRQARVENDYRRSAQLLWGSLNAWLEAWEGERGVPTAYAVGGHAFIGLPMSQAVVREYDRGGLHELFALEGMTPGLHVSPGDMSSAMDPHATATPSPLSSHLVSLWRVPAARERIVEAACVELEAWDGSGVDVASPRRRPGSASLLAFLRVFPRRSMEFNLMIPYRSDHPDVALFELPTEVVIVPTVAGPGGSTRLSGAEGVSAASLIGDQLQGTFGHDEHHRISRRPRRVAPLRWDDLQGAFVEVELISLGDDCIVLAHAQTRELVEDHLSAHARPGWRELVGVPGVPDGWLVYEHVQVISAPVEQFHRDLSPLVPRSRTSLTIRGGFVLPGLLRKWSAHEPPEVVALAAGAETIDVRVYRGTRINSDQLVVQASRKGELAVLPLSDEGLTDGEYFVAMFVDGATRAASTALLRLRSADTPQLRIEDADIRLVYSPDSSPRWPVSAGPADWSRFVNGARIKNLASSGRGPTMRMTDFVPRQRSSAVPSPTSVRVGVPMPNDSCLVTGMHRFLLPPVLPGRSRTRSIEGECETCGLVRHFAGTPWAAKKKSGPDTGALLPAELPPVTEPEGPDFEVAFDAINHIGAGPFGIFERISAQVEGSGLFADSFLRRLEVVGHIDVARNEYFQVTEWAINSSTLVPVGERRWVLIGSRSPALLTGLTKLVDADGEVVSSVDAQLSRIEVIGSVPASGLADLGIYVLDESPASVIASALPPLGALAESLKRIVVPSYRSAEFWNTSSATWEEARNLVRVGAYRLKDFASTYAIRSADDLDNGTIGVGNAQIVKHIANMWARDPLVGYHSRSRSVVMPMGADLPALYGRALALCSGRAPRELVKQRMLQYPSVPRDVANIIFDRVSR